MKQDLVDNLKSRNRFLTNLLDKGGYTDYICFQDYDSDTGNITYKALNYPRIKQYMINHGSTYTDKIFEVVEESNQDIEFMDFIHSEFDDSEKYPPLNELSDFLFVHAEELINMWSD